MSALALHWILEHFLQIKCCYKDCWLSRSISYSSLIHLLSISRQFHHFLQCFKTSSASENWLYPQMSVQSTLTIDQTVCRCLVNHQQNDVIVTSLQLSSVCSTITVTVHLHRQTSPSLSDFTITIRLHHHCQTSPSLSKFTITVRLHHHHQTSPSPSDFTITVRLYRHCHYYYYY